MAAGRQPDVRSGMQHRAIRFLSIGAGLVSGLGWIALQRAIRGRPDQRPWRDSIAACQEKQAQHDKKRRWFTQQHNVPLLATDSTLIDVWPHAPVSFLRKWRQIKESLPA